MKFFRSILLLLALVAPLQPGRGEISYGQQQTPPPQGRTGRSYSSDSGKAPPRTAKQYRAPVAFNDITNSCGITFRHSASVTSQKYLIETMGGGVAMLDYDGDGRLDLYFTNGAKLEDPMPKGAAPDKRDPKYWNRLYRQKADGSFEDVTERAGVKGEGYSMGVAVGDYDNDGKPDLYVTGYGANTLYHNEGDGTFSDVTKQLGVSGGGWSTSAGWFDYDRDGRLDLFVARCADWDFEKGSIFCGDPRPGMRAYCHPDNFKGAQNLLYHQRPDGKFEDVTEKAKITDPEGKGLGVAFSDIDSDRWTDVIVANDSVPQSLYRNKGDGTFENIALLAGMGYDENGKTFAGMGVDAGDYDEDGHPDIIITVLSNETCPLFRNNGDNTFSYATNSTGVGQITVLYTGWGVRFTDIDNDGLRDIFAAQCHVLDTIEKSSSYLKYKQTPLLMLNTGKGFVDVSNSAGFNMPLAARGAALGDIDNDGDIDIVIGVVDGAPVVLRNKGTKNHWISIEHSGTRSNRDGLGARVAITDSSGKRRIFEMTNAGSYLSAGDARLLIGPGSEESLRSIDIEWPGNRTQTLEKPPIDRYHRISEK